MTSTELDQLFEQLEILLRKHGENNWIRGICAARDSLKNGDSGIERAKSIYRNMCSGAGSFSDFNIWNNNYDIRMSINRPIDDLRARLWNACDG